MKSTRSKKRKKKEIDPKYIGVPNICFSITTEDDKREKRFRKQRLTRGFDDSETWGLRDTIANFILPRLKRHREIIDGVLVNEGELYENCERAIRAFELVARDNGNTIWTKKESNEYVKGIKAFAKVFMRLWW